MQDISRLARAFKALSSPHRLSIFREIVRRQALAGEDGVEAPGCLLGDFFKRLGIGAPTVSHHLRELADAGLIELHREGRQLRCAVCPDVPAALLDAIKE